MDNLINTLQKTYGANTPIFTHEILGLFPDISEVAIHKRINKALNAGELKRERRGVYYIPTTDKIFDETRELPLNQMDILKKKYIGTPEVIYGFVSGLQLENDAGLSQQVPAVLEITTNNESSRKRSIGAYAGYRDVVIRRSPLPVDAHNVAALETINLITNVSFPALNAEQLNRLRRKCQNTGHDAILECLGALPASASKKTLEAMSYGIFT